MANPRQRLKARSGNFKGSSASSKRRQKQRLVKAPAIKGPDVLKEKWDKKKTVKQNYAALGLASDLKLRPSGGVEGGVTENEPASTPAASTSTSRSRPAKGLGRIIRDEEGNVIDIIEGGEEEDGETPWGKSMKGWEDDEQQREQEGQVNNKPAKKSSELVQSEYNWPRRRQPDRFQAHDTTSSAST